LYCSKYFIFIPTRTCEQKYSRVKSEAYSFFKSGVNFAKSQGVTPFNYGIYVGNLYAPNWNPEIGFDGFVKSAILTWESLRAEQDDKIIITEKQDGSVLMEFPKNAIIKYFAGEKPIATFEEVIDFFRGLMKPIADKYNGSVTITITETFLAFNFKKN
jgi:hypothetical protein